MKKKLILVVCSILFLFACNDEENITDKESNGLRSGVTDSNINNSVKQLSNGLPLIERIELELAKEKNSAGSIFQGQFDNRKIGYATFAVDSNESLIKTDYILEENLQLELIDFIKKIELELIQASYYNRLESFDFLIIRPAYATYFEGPYIAIDLEKRELCIAGGESLMPNLYKVSKDEDLVFEKLKNIFNQSKKVAS